MLNISRIKSQIIVSADVDCKPKNEVSGTGQKQEKGLMGQNEINGINI